MSYQLAVDLGTTRLSAAVARPDGGVEPAALGAGAGGADSTVPAVVHVDADGRLLVGAAAQRRTLTDPDRVVLELVRRIGDRTPLVVGGTPVAAEVLAARVVAHVARTVATTEGGPAAAVAVTHPTAWGPHKVQALRAALDAVGLDRAVLLTEARAAAERHAAVADPGVGALLAVLDVGGGTCDATVLRRDPGGFTPVGRPERIERLGGTDIDEVVFEHVRAELGPRWADLDPADPATLAAVAALRRDCTAAKEALSGSAEVAVPVALPGIRTDVELTRARLVELIRPAVGEAVDLLQRVVEPVGAGTVLLVGGCARIPLVVELVAQRTGLAVVRPDDPAAAVAAGAALAVRPPARAPRPAGPVPVGAGPGTRPDLERIGDAGRPAALGAAVGAGVGAGAGAGVGTAMGTLPGAAPPPPPPPRWTPPADGPGDPPGGVRPFRPDHADRPGRPRVPLLAAVLAAVVALAAVVGGVVALSRAGTVVPTGSPAVASTPDPTTTAPAPTTTAAAPTAAPRAPQQPRPERPAPPAGADGPAAPPPAPAPPVTSAPAEPPATTAPAAEEPQGGDQDGDGEQGDQDAPGDVDAPGDGGEPDPSAPAVGAGPATAPAPAADAGN